MGIRMNFTTLASNAIACAMLLTVMGCGGGGESAGSLTEFSVVPTEITLTGPDENTCGGGDAGRVYIYGGAGPYRVDSTLPGVVFVTAVTMVGPSSGYFDVFVVPGACLTTIPVVAVDMLGRTAEFEVNTEKGEAP
jgi:hypothetical protein